MRWLAPIAVAALGATVAVGVYSVRGASAAALPQRSAAELVADAETAQLHPFTGTVVATTHLGLPDLPTLPGSGGESSTTGLLSLLAGSHTFRVWYGGTAKQRIALLDAVGEQDVFHDGRDLWQWNSATRQASHTSLPAARTAAPAATATLTPSQLAQRALTLLGPSTTVATEPNVTVAGRSAYVLALSPRQATSRVGRVQVAIDGSSKVPLSVQVFGRDSAQAAITVAFTDFSPSTPSDSQFRFTPAEDVTVTERTAGSGPSADTAEPTLIGSGWTSVLEVRAPGALADAGPQIQLLLGVLPTVRSGFGTGHLLSSSLVSVLITDDGRVFAGAVDPSSLVTVADGH